MPETAKFGTHEEAIAKAEEPGIGAKKTSADLAETFSQGQKAKPPTPEYGAHKPQTSEAPQLQSPERDGRKLADAATAGLAKARATEVKEPDGGEESFTHGDEQGFFAGWDAFDDINDSSADEDMGDEEDDSEPFEGELTLAEIAAASGVLQPLDGPDESGSSLSSKHDELASAVQAALLSVYGEASSAPHSRQASPFPADSKASGPGWASEDTLSPQDVILNYFDYQPSAGHAPSQTSRHADVEYQSDAPGVFAEPPEYPSPQRRSQRSDAPAAYAAYEEFSTYLSDHDASEKGADKAERENSRLLGAAAVGLVGGIAMAASLAVFVISSYGPGGRAGAAFNQANQAADASPPGYGRWIKRGAEPESSKAAAAPDAAPVLTAADVLVTAGQPSSLAIEVKPEPADEKSLISITGIPDGARLNAGVDAGGGNWLLPPARLKGLTINVPSSAPDTASLGVQVLDGNVRTPLSDKKQFSIRVTPAKSESAASAAIQPRPQPDLAVLQRPQPETAAVQPPPDPAPAPETPKPPSPAPSFFSTETVPAPASQTTPQEKPAGSAAAPREAAPSRQAALELPGAPSDQPKAAPGAELQDLIQEGNRRMREGDILKARQLYQKAVAFGDPEAALAMGRSYDPAYFARLARRNAEPDAAKAFAWYRKAMDRGGAQTAKVRIDNLKHFLNQ